MKSPPKLLDQVRHYLRVRHYSIKTEKTYVAWIKRYIEPLTTQDLESSGLAVRSPVSSLPMGAGAGAIGTPEPILQEPEGFRAKASRVKP